MDNKLFQISAAMTEIKRALQLDSCHVNSLHLLMLLLSAEKKVSVARDWYKCQQHFALV